MRWRLLCSGAALAAVFATASLAQQPSPAAPAIGAPAAPAAAPSTAPATVPAAPADPAAPTQAAPPEAAATAPEAASGADHSAPAAKPPAFDPTLLYVFLLATFIGLGVITRVSRLLHTPLMSLTNAISAIAVVGSIVITGGSHYPLPIRIMGTVALFASMTNIVSGFLITDRMLKMFKKRDGDKG